MNIRNIQVYVEIDEELYHVGQLWARSTRIKKEPLSVAKEYGIEQGLAKKIAKNVAESVKNWKMHAKSYKISSAEIERMSSAFMHEDFFQAISF